jgi:hypothetical protein
LSSLSSSLDQRTNRVTDLCDVIRR